MTFNSIRAQKSGRNNEVVVRPGSTAMRAVLRVRIFNQPSPIPPSPPTPEAIKNLYCQLHKIVPRVLQYNKLYILAFIVLSSISILRSRFWDFI